MVDVEHRRLEGVEAESARIERRRSYERAIAKSNRVKIAAPTLLKAREDFVAMYRDRLSLILKGSIVAEDHELAFHHPEAWKAA